MQTFLKAMLAAAALAAATPAAAAPNPETVSDVRCVMTMLVLRQNPQNAQSAQAAIYFFGGRINARDPNADLAGIMKAEAPGLNAASIEGEAKRCGPIVNTGMQPIQAGLTKVIPPAPAGAAAPRPATPGPTPPPK